MLFSATWMDPEIVILCNVPATFLAFKNALLNQNPLGAQGFLEPETPVPVLGPK